MTHGLARGIILGMARKQPIVFTAEKQEIFIRHLARYGVVTAAAEEVGVHPATCHALRDRNPTFAKLWDMALDMATDELELEARNRALEGRLKPVWYKGEIVGTVREPSDKLLVELLRANRDKFNRKVESTIKGEMSIVDIIRGDPLKQEKG